MNIQTEVFIIALVLSALLGWFIAIIMMGTRIAERNKKIIKTAKPRKREGTFFTKE